MYSYIRSIHILCATVSEDRPSPDLSLTNAAKNQNYIITSHHTIQYNSNNVNNNYDTYIHTYLAYELHCTIPPAYVFCKNQEINDEVWYM